MSTLPDFMHAADNLTDAAVALESTVISHGLPYPHNIQLALRLEEIVREPARPRPPSASSPARSSSGWTAARSSTWRRLKASAR